MAKRGRPRKMDKKITKPDRTLNAATVDVGVKRHTRRVKEKPVPPKGPLTGVTLGPLVLPEPDDAVRVLGELGTLNDRALAAHAVYLEAKEAAKEAKAHWEQLAEEVQTQLRLVTHGSELPLFDAAELEGDQAKMLEAAIPIPGDGSTEPEGAFEALETAQAPSGRTNGSVEGVEGGSEDSPF